MNTGCDRPALKLLNKHVRKDVSSKWHDLGLELLEQEDEQKLHEIKMNNPKDASECCKEMFQLWLEKCSNASWNQLIQALREVELSSLASKIEEILIPMQDTVYPRSEPRTGSYVIIYSDCDTTHRPVFVKYVITLPVDTVIMWMIRPFSHTRSEYNNYS